MQIIKILKNEVLIGIFDVNPKFSGESIRGIPIQNIDELYDFIKKNNVHIAALTVPKQQAIGIAQKLVRHNIKAIWNFAPIDLNLPSDVIVQNVHLAESLMQLSYALKANEEALKKSED